MLRYLLDMSGFLEDEKLRYVWNIKGVTIGITRTKSRRLLGSGGCPGWD